MIDESELYSKISSFFSSKQFCDFSFIINGHEFKLHRAILYKMSGFFQDLFIKNKDLNKYEMNISDELFSCFEDFLLYFYCSKDFCLDNNKFCPITELALMFNAQQLMRALNKWARSNLDEKNVLIFFEKLLPVKDKIKTLYDLFVAQIITSYGKLNDEEIANIIPFETFSEIISVDKLTISSFKKSLSIVIYFSKHKNLSDHEKSVLLNLYFKIDWAVNIPDIFNNASLEQRPKIIKFAAKHFNCLTISELLKLPDEALISLLSSDEINEIDETAINDKIQLLASTPQKRNISQKLLNSIRDNNHSKTFLKKIITPKNLRCLVLGSTVNDFLDDIKQSLLDNDLEKINIEIYNADYKSTPDLEFIFHFDVIIVLTYYQFYQPEVISNHLAKFVLHKGGGLVFTFGFMRDDNWGCGSDENLLKLLPFSRGEREKLESSKEDDILKIRIVKDHPILKDVTCMTIHRYLLRAKVKMNKNGHLLATYDFDDTPFIAYSDVPNSTCKIVGLNFYPITQRVIEDGIDLDSPCANIIARSVKFSVGIEL